MGANGMGQVYGGTNSRTLDIRLKLFKTSILIFRKENITI